MKMTWTDEERRSAAETADIITNSDPMPAAAATASRNNVRLLAENESGVNGNVATTDIKSEVAQAEEEFAPSGAKVPSGQAEAALDPPTQ